MSIYEPKIGLQDGFTKEIIKIKKEDCNQQISIKIKDITNHSELHTTDKFGNFLTDSTEEKDGFLITSLTKSLEDQEIIHSWGDRDSNGLLPNENSFILRLVDNFSIDLSTPLKTCYDTENLQVSQNNPICLGIETDNQANDLMFVFNNASNVKNCQCIVSLEAANGNKSIQEIKYTDCSNNAFNPNNTIKENATEIVLNWKPNNFLMQEKGLVKFAFQFYRLNKNGEYDFVLNTAPIYGYVHEGINAMQGIGSNIYPSEIADLYSKYNSLLDDEDIADLDSFEDIKLYLQTLVPFNIGADEPTTDAPDNSTNTWYILAYNPVQKRYGYVPAAMLDKEVIHGQVWNAGDYTGIELTDLPEKVPELN